MKGPSESLGQGLQQIAKSRRGSTSGKGSGVPVGSQQHKHQRVMG